MELDVKAFASRGTTNVESLRFRRTTQTSRGTCPFVSASARPMALSASVAPEPEAFVESSMASSFVMHIPLLNLFSRPLIQSIRRQLLSSLGQQFSHSPSALINTFPELSRSVALSRHATGAVRRVSMFEKTFLSDTGLPWCVLSAGNWNRIGIWIARNKRQPQWNDDCRQSPNTTLQVVVESDPDVVDEVRVVGLVVLELHDAWTGVDTLARAHQVHVTPCPRTYPHLS